MWKKTIFFLVWEDTITYMDYHSSASAFNKKHNLSCFPSTHAKFLILYSEKAKKIASFVKIYCKIATQALAKAPIWRHWQHCRSTAKAIVFGLIGSHINRP